MSKKPIVEKRKNLRTDFLKGALVSWEGSGQGSISRISDIGAGGLFVKTPHPAPAGTTINLVLQVDDREIRATVVVRHSMIGLGMGVEFVTIGNEDQASLLNLVTAPVRAADPPAAPVEHSASQRGWQRPTKTENGSITNDSPTPRHPERRAHPRHKFVTVAEITEIESGSRSKARLVNLGRSGCYMKAENPPRVGTEIKVSITKGAESFRAQARIVFSMPGEGMGVEFMAMDPEESRTLDAWLEKSVELAWRVENRQRGQRLTLSFPVQISGTSKGKPFVEETQTITISPYGASFPLSVATDKGQRLSLSNLRTQAVLECVVNSVIQNRGDKREIGVSFLLPDRAFWRVAFPPTDWSSRHPDAKRA